MRAKLSLVAVAFLGVPLTVLAHHSFAAEFDANKPLVLKGTITRVDLVNPHAWLYMNVTDADGKVVNWGFETGGVNSLYRQGWRKEDLQAGTVLVIDGWRARNGTPTANALSIKFPDGRRLFAGTSAPKTVTEGK